MEEYSIVVTSLFMRLYTWEYPLSREIYTISAIS